MKTKTAVLLSGALIALLLLARYFALSRAGLPLGWMLYLGLPITAGGVLFALRLINLGSGWGARDTRPPAHPIAHSYPQPPVPVSERFRELEALREDGAISDAEYSAKRAHIISEL
ncbi:SHOCT domain-containing protein [Mycobacterium sp. 1081908.1]|uniref:SHOCT domain-containing protein n=1 Tax=Mycobacterium sp. 1081908.1 TaxID=1834066 RepID=UPI0007FF0BDB|nr:SHOCT domain-containing protein [Mycobacterium sp. 1081908.1]OBK48164.1 hypothetical protein A5655_04880 [Mycobacterium sp. 1081908.1]